MCGRVHLSLDPRLLKRLAGTEEGPSEVLIRLSCAQKNWWEDEYKPSFNVPPGANQPILVEKKNEKKLAFQMMQWGLVPLEFTLLLFVTARWHHG